MPDGIYRIVARHPESHFDKSLRIGYPTLDQAVVARRLGIDLGGDIMTHGLPNGLGWLGRWHRLRDWTAGCVAVTDAEMDEIWSAGPLGTIVEIRPVAARASEGP